MARRVPDRFRKIARLTKVQMEPGPYPNTWTGTGGITSSTHYLHSSIRGFNADYIDLTHRIKLGSVFQSLAEQIYHTSCENVQLLHEVSQQTRRTFFMSPDTSKPVEEDPIIHTLLEPSQQDPTYVRDIQNLKKVLNWTDFEDKIIQYLNDVYTQGGTVKHHKGDTDYTTFYRQVGDRIGTILQTFVDNTKKITTTDVQSARDRVQTILQAATQQPNGFGDLILSPQWKSLIHKDEFATILGYAYEDLITISLQQALNSIANQFATQLTVSRTGQNKKIADAIISGQPIIITGQERFAGAEINPAISAKLRRQNAFSPTAQVKFSDLVNRLQYEGSLEHIQALAYIYDNYIALSTWNTSEQTNRGTTRYSVGRKSNKQVHLSSYKHRKEAIIASNTSLGQFFKPLALYINILMLNLSFFGNTIDAGHISMFDPDFFNKLDENIGQQVATPPAFLWTAQHIYETADVFYYYLDQAYNHGNLLFTTNNIFANALSTATSPYRASDLQDLYRRKRNILRGDHPNDSIYPLLQSQNIMAFVPPNSAFQTMLANNSRTLTTKFKLAEQYPHYTY